MKQRAYFYLIVVLITVGLSSYYLVRKKSIIAEEKRLTKTQQEEHSESFRGYLAKQQDERKLVTLAKHLSRSDAILTKLAIERAYELNPNSRDIVILASQYRPELKERIKELDPLWNAPDN